MTLNRLFSKYLLNEWKITPKKGNGTPLQYSCLENPVDGGAWWAAVHGVATERLHFHFSLSCIGEGNGNPLQCSCLENPRDGGAWWAAIYRVIQSRIRLKWVSIVSISNLPLRTRECVPEGAWAAVWLSAHHVQQLHSLCIFSGQEFKKRVENWF